MADNTENEWVASNRILVFARDENAAKKRWSLSKMAFFWKSKRPIAIHFFLATTNVCPVAILKSLRIHKDSITGNSFIDILIWEQEWKV